MNYNSICCYDLETGSPDAASCDIIQIAAEMIHGRNLKVISRFNSFIRPKWDSPGIDDETINWHSEQRRIPKEQFVAMLNAAPTIEVVWPKFTAWVDKYNWAKGNKNVFCAPISGGYNVTGFDNIIMRRYCLALGPTEKDKKLGIDQQRLFSDVYSLDILQHMWFWFENNSELKNLKLRTLLEFMGVTETELEKAHDAVFDVSWCSQILIRLLQTGRWMTSWNDDIQKRRLEFKGCFTGGKTK